MRHYIFFFLFLFLFLFAFGSCVYENNDNHFVEVSQEIDPPEIVNRTLDFESDTIYIWQNTQFHFDLTSSKQGIFGVIVEYENQQRQFEGSKGSFNISPFNLTDGSYELTMKVYVGSGTGSLADKFGAEQLEFSRTWVLIIEKPGPPNIEIKDFQIENGFLKISWDKMERPYFKSYRLRIHNNGTSDIYSKDFTNRDNTSFVDSFFVGGEIQVDLSTFYENGNGSTDIHRTESTYNYDVQVQFEERQDSIIFTWENPFQCKVLYGENSQDHIHLGSSNTYSVKAPGLGQEKRYMIAFKPLKKTTFNHQMYDHYFSYSRGKKLSSDFENILYNKALDSYFAKDAMNIIKYDNTILEKARYDFSYDYHDNHSLTLSDDNQYLYSVVKQQLVKLNQNDLQKHNSTNLIYNEDREIRTRLVEFLNEKIVLIGYDSYYALFDIETGEIISKTPILRKYGLKQEQEFSISPDKKFVSFCDDQGLLIYEIIDNKEFVLRYDNQEKYFYGFFHPTQPGLFIINGEDFVYIFNYVQQQMVKTIKSPIGNPVNIDPVTGNLLLVSNANKKIYIYDINNDEIKFEIDHHDRALNFKLLNNIIFHKPGNYYHVPE